MQGAGAPRCGQARYGRRSTPRRPRPCRRSRRVRGDVGRVGVLTTGTVAQVPVARFLQAQARLDLLRGRGRPDPAPAPRPNLGPARTHPRRAVSGKGSGRISIAGLLAYRPGHRPHLYYRLVVHRGRRGERRSLSEADYAALLTAAHQQLHGPIILIRDNLGSTTGHNSNGRPRNEVRLPYRDRADIHRGVGGGRRPQFHRTDRPDPAGAAMGRGRSWGGDVMGQ